MTLRQRHVDLCDERLRLLLQRTRILQRLSASKADAPGYRQIIEHIEHELSAIEARLELIEMNSAEPGVS